MAGDNAHIYRLSPCFARRLMSAGFKAGQSPRGRLGYGVECAQTIAAGMSAIEPTVVISFPSRSSVLGDIIAEPPP